jgi:predicted RNase H-like nuclease (RuvC/YqgF family)
MSALQMDVGDEFIIGFDILPSHSVGSKSTPKYACVIMRDGVVLNEYSEVTRRELLRIVREIKPKWLCTDNVFEIVRDSKSLFRFVGRIPSKTHLVQVTGVPPHQTSLKRLARRYGIPVRGKLSPLEAAKTSAQLVSRGIGHYVECFGEQTEIKIARGRKPGRGGQSANRFRRRVHSQIQQMTRHIESTLKEAGIDYDIHTRNSDFGYSSARLVTNAPLPAVRNLIESKREGDFKVLVAPVRKRVEFLPLEPKAVPLDTTPKFFILGLDPGTTAAYCLLGFNGKVRLLKSRKGLTRADIIRDVYERGIPVLVAADVPNAPNLVEKIARTVNAPVYTPDRPIPVAEKNEVAREYAEEIKVRNAHERDSLTAAAYAYRNILPKLQQIDRMIREEEIDVDKNHLKALVVKGTPINEAIASIQSERVEFSEAAPSSEDKVDPATCLTQERFDALRARIEALEDQNAVLEERVDDFRRVNEFLRFRESELAESLDIVSRENYWKVKRDREVAKTKEALRKSEQTAHEMRGEVEALKKRLEILKGVRRLEMKGDMLAIKVIPHFTRESIEEYSKKVGLRAGDIILFEDASGGGPHTAILLIEREIRAVVVDTPLSHLPREELVRALIPVVDANEVELRRIDEFAFISRKKLEARMQTFMRDVREEARKKGEEDLVELVERYRREGRC